MGRNKRGARKKQRECPVYSPSRRLKRPAIEVDSGPPSLSFLSFFFSSRLRLAVESEGKRFGRETERYWLKPSIGKLNREPTRATSTRDIFPIEPQLRLPKATFGRSLGITMLHPLA